MGRRDGFSGDEVQTQMPVEPGKSPVERVENSVIRRQRIPVPKISKTEDEKQPKDPSLQTPKPVDLEPGFLVPKGLERKPPSRGGSRIKNSASGDQAPTGADSEDKIHKKGKAREQKHEDIQLEVSKAKIPPPSAADLAMSSLIGQLDQTLKIEDKATTASKMVEVPSGYKLDLELGTEEFYKVQADCKLLDKRKRAAGLLPMSTKRYQRYGFRPEELLSAGALYSPNAKPSNLTNELHPFFHRSRFDDTPDFIYDQLVPGLRLATMFLTQPICCQYWVTLAKGQRKTDWNTSNRLGRNCLRISKDIPMTLENAVEVIEYIKSLDNASIIHFAFKEDLYIHAPKDVLARTMPICDVDFEIPGGLTFRPKRSHVCLHHDFYTAANKLSKLRHPDPALILRFNFFLACNILHEMGHAINVAHCYAQQTIGGLNSAIDYNEPFLLDDTEAELGCAWEKYMFGGRVAPINGRVDTSHGLSICDWPFVGLPKDFPPVVGLPLDFRRGSLAEAVMDNKQHILYSIPMKFIENIQQMSTWQQRFDLKDTKFFHVKRDGAVSISMNRFTTMPWAEELRIVHESLTSLATSPNVDGEPPAKKRETASGKAVRTDVWGTTFNDDTDDNVKGKSEGKKAVKGAGLQGTKTKVKGLQSRHRQQVRAKNIEKRKRQEEAEKRNAGPH